MAYLRRERSPLTAVTVSPDDAPASLDAAYAAIAAQTGRTPDVWRAWKLGGSNHASRAAFGVDRLYYGAIHEDEILTTPDRAPGFDLIGLQGEVEIALRLGADGATPDAWCVALEMPASPVTNLPGAGVAVLVADRCAAGALLLGPAQPMDTLSTMASATFSLQADGETIATGSWQDLVAPPSACLADFIELAAGHGIAPRPGDWVATGGITPCKPLPEGARVAVLANDSIALDFLVTRSTA